MDVCARRRFCAFPWLQLTALFFHSHGTLAGSESNKMNLIILGRTQHLSFLDLTVLGLPGLLLDHDRPDHVRGSTASWRHWQSALERVLATLRLPRARARRRIATKPRPTVSSTESSNCDHVFSRQSERRKVTMATMKANKADAISGQG